MKNHEIAQKIRDLRAEIGEIKEEEDLLHVRLRNKINEAKKTQAKRDELNKVVQKLSRKPKELMGERKEIWDDIKDKNSKKRNVIKEIKPYLRRIGELRKERDVYNSASRGTMDRLVENYNGIKKTLMESDMNLKNELSSFEFLFELRDRLYAKKQADRLHMEIVRIKEEELSRYNERIYNIEETIGEMKEKSHEELQAAKEMWSERDEVRDEAQKFHAQLMELNNEIRDIKKDIGKQKRKKKELIRRIEDWKREFKKSKEERAESDKNRRLTEAREKYKRGESLSLDEMGLLLEAGELKD